MARFLLATGARPREFPAQCLAAEDARHFVNGDSGKPRNNRHFRFWKRAESMVNHTKGADREQSMRGRLRNSRLVGCLAASTLLGILTSPVQSSAAPVISDTLTLLDPTGAIVQSAVLTEADEQSGTTSIRLKGVWDSDSALIIPTFLTEEGFLSDTISSDGTDIILTSDTEGTGRCPFGFTCIDEAFALRNGPLDISAYLSFDLSTRGFRAFATSDVPEPAALIVLAPGLSILGLIRILRPADRRRGPAIAPDADL